MSDEKKPFHNPFAALSHLRGELPAEPARKDEPVRAKSIARAVVRLEGSNRGSKVVTVVEHMGLDAAESERWLAALKAALGCGGTIEGNTLVLQGDQRGRLPRLLTSRGVKKVTLG